MSESELGQGDEVSLFDLWQKLQSGWRYVVGGTAIGVLGAWVAIALIPPKYEAVAVLQVGQVGQIGQVGQVGQVGSGAQIVQGGQFGQIFQVSSVPVEPATQTVERMKTPAFQSNVAESLGNQSWIDGLKRASAATSQYLSLQVIKGTVLQGPLALLELKVSAESAESAKKIADASVLELVKRHAEIAKPTIERMRQDLAIARERLASAEKELEGINKLVANAGVKDDRFTQLSLMTSLRLQKEAELFSQRQMVIALETALSAPATQPAKAIEAVFVTDNPVSPKKGMLLALGLVGGLLAGVVAVFFVAAWRRAKEGR